ncbi:MAG: cytochrome c biogenesis protein CcsA [Archaeoglobaceae archaeon]
MIEKVLLAIGAVALVFGGYNAMTLPTKIESYRIVFIHVPSAITSYLAFTVSFLYSILYLRSKDSFKDFVANASAKIGLILAVIAFVTGAIWAKSTWGTYFTWYEIREVLVLLLIFVYAIYFSIRNIVGSEKERFSALYLIIAFVTVPFSYIAGFFSPLHPRPFEAEFSFEWRLNLFLMIFGFFTSYASYMLWIAKAKKPKSS